MNLLALDKAIIVDIIELKVEAIKVEENYSEPMVVVNVNDVATQAIEID